MRGEGMRHNCGIGGRGEGGCGTNVPAPEYLVGWRGHQCARVPARRDKCGELRSLAAVVSSVYARDGQCCTLPPRFTTLRSCSRGSAANTSDMTLEHQNFLRTNPQTYGAGILSPPERWTSRPNAAEFVRTTTARNSSDGAS